MKKLTREQMKQVTGGTGSTRFLWYCYGPEGSGWDYICSDMNTDPSTVCTQAAVGSCYQTNCSMTGTKCTQQTICIC